MQIFPTPVERKSLPTRGIISSPPFWIKQKVSRDQELWKSDNNKIWIIENKMYDLTNYMDKHPGGQSWLRLTQGQDITQHFIVHHLNQKKARDILPKYYVGQCPQKNTRFTFEQNGLYRTVKNQLLKNYKIEEIQKETTSKIYAIIILTLWIACVLTAIYKNSFLFAVLCAPLMIGLVGIGHNFIHHHESWYRYFLLLVGFTDTQWKIMHCISHHLYPNTQLDFQIAVFEPIGYYLRNRPKNKWYLQLFLEILLIFLQPVNMILKLFIIPIIRLSVPDFKYGFPLIIIGISLYFHTFSQAFQLYMAIYCTFSFLFMKVLFCGHRVQDVWSQGAEKIQDFGEHTISATSDTDNWIHGFFSYLLLAGFNLHIAHHFFPTADHSMLPSIQKIIKKVCQKRGYKKNQKNRLQCMASINKGFMRRIPFIRK